MHAIWKFIKRTLLGGLLVLLPAYLAVLLLLKGLQGITALVKPLASMLPIDASHHTVFAVILIVLVSFLIGLALQTWPGKRLGHWFSNKVLARIPGYGVMSNIVRRTFGDDSSEFRVAFVQTDEALVVGFVVEEHADGRFTVFLPGSPTPFSGAVLVLTPDRVHIVDVPFMQAFQAMAKWGTGTRELIEAMDRQKAKAG